MLKTCHFLLFLCVFGWASQAQDYVQLPEFPGDARDDAVAELVNGYIYYGTGYDAFFSPRNDFWRYSLLEQSWEQLPGAPFSPRQYSASANIGVHIYVISGWNSPDNFFSEVWRLNTRDLNWKRLGDFPGEARWAGVAAESAGRVYFGLGRDTAQKFTDWWRYDPETGHWKQLPDLPGAGRSLAFAEAVDNQIWIGLGEDSTGNPLNDIWVYDIEKAVWQSPTYPELPGLKHPATAVLHDEIYVAGGEAMDTVSTDLRKISPGKNEIENYGAPGFQHGRGGNLLSDGCRLFLVGGLSVDYQRLNDFGVIEFPAYAESVPEVYPNPAATELTVLHPEEAKNIEVFDLSRKRLMDVPAKCDQTEIDLSRLGAGTYFVRWCGEGCSGARTFLVKD